MTKTAHTPLKPCPFCGDDACCSPAIESDEPEREDREPVLWGVGCSCTAFVGPWPTEAGAIAAWNTRAAPESIANPDVVPEAIEALRTAERALTWAARRMACEAYSDVVLNDARNVSAILAKLEGRS